jgi:hypothetical protein
VPPSSAPKMVTTQKTVICSTTQLLEIHFNAMISSGPSQTLLEQAKDEMGGACSTHGNTCRVLIGKPEGSIVLKTT